MGQHKVVREKLNLDTLTKRKLAKINLDEEMDDRLRIHVGAMQLKKRMTECLETEGKVYVYKREKQIVGFFLFRKENVDMNVLYVEAKDILNKEAEEKEGENKSQTVFSLVDYYILPEYSDKMGMMKNEILKELKEICVFEGYAAIIWGKEVIRQKAMKIGKGYILALPFGLGVGFLFGLALDNIALGICLGLSFALAYSGIWSSVENKRKN